MNLRKITIENFRCFLNYEIEFAQKVTVLFGKNGCGKSTLIHSLHKAISVFFSTDSTFGETLSSGNPDLKVANISPTDVWYNTSNREVAQYVSLQCEGSFGKQDLKWEMNKNSSSRAGLKTTYYQKAFRSFIKEYKSNKVLPVFAYYSDSFPHVGTNIGKYAKEILNSSKPLPRNFGYYQWDAETSCTAIWELRFLKVWAELLNINTAIDLNLNRIVSLKSDLETIKKSIDIGAGGADKLPAIQSSLNNAADIFEYRNKEKSKLTSEIDFIRTKLIEFSTPVSYDANQNDNFKILDVSVTNMFAKNRILFTLSDKREISFDQLPQGFKRLFSIVFDIAYRAYILNGDTDPSGIVMIDEIDLHLHPSLEQEILQRFKRTFPNIQFIVTTHSPLVLTNLKQDDDNKVIKMRFEDGIYDNDDMPNLFGIDYNISISDIMETPSRNSTVENMIDSIIRLKVRGKEGIADKRYQELKTFVKGDMETIDEVIKLRLSANQ